MSTLSDFEKELIGLRPFLVRLANWLTRGSYEVEDLVQTTVQRALAGQDGFTPGTNMQAWLTTIMKNLYVSQCRKRTVMAQRHPLVQQVPSFCDRAEAPNQEIAAMLRQAMELVEKLPRHMRETLTLVVIEGERIECVAQRLGIAAGTVKSRVLRARAMLVQMSEGTPQQ